MPAVALATTTIRDLRREVSRNGPDGSARSDNSTLTASLPTNRLRCGTSENIGTRPETTSNMTSTKQPVGAADFEAALLDRIAAVEANARPDLELRPVDYLLVTVVTGVLPVLAIVAGCAGWFA